MSRRSVLRWKAVRQTFSFLSRDQLSWQGSGQWVWPWKIHVERVPAWMLELLYSFVTKKEGLLVDGHDSYLIQSSYPLPILVVVQKDIYSSPLFSIIPMRYPISSLPLPSFLPLPYGFPWSPDALSYVSVLMLFQDHGNCSVCEARLGKKAQRLSVVCGWWVHQEVL